MDEQVVVIGGVIGGGIVVLGLIIVAVVASGRKKRKSTAAPTPNAAKSADIILSTIDDGVLLIDAEGTIQLFNRGASIITGWQSEEAIGLNYQGVIKLTDDKNTAYTDAENPFARALREMATIRDSGATLTSRSEKHIPLSLTVSPLIGNDQTLQGAVGVFRDVSREREQEAQRGEFISTASHEMRTPIAAIEGYLSLVLNAKDNACDPKTRDYLTKAYGATKHLGKLFQDLLSSSQAEDGRLQASPVVIDVGAFLEGLLDDLRFSAEKKGLSIELVMGTERSMQVGHSKLTDTSNKIVKPLYFISADPDRLREAISNLFDNAVKYSDSGTISIGLTGDEDVVQIYVRDTGVGIAPEDLPHLFQKFYRIDNSATRTIGGNGLGLYISRMIVEQANGKIWATSEQGKGSTFFINLPRLSGQQAADKTKEQSANNIVRPTVVQ